MAEQKRTCGQCEFYLNKKEKCPHQEKTAFSEGCEIFVYTNPEVRIDGLRAENELLKTLLQSAADFAKLAEGTEITEEAMKLKTEIEQALKGC